jgi:hypothetical protein
MYTIFPHPIGWRDVAKSICDIVDGRHSLLSDIWPIVRPWAANAGSPAPPEKYDSNRLLAAAALVVNCARVALALHRGEPVGEAQQPPIDDHARLQFELTRFIGDVGRWVDDDVKCIVIDAAAEAVSGGNNNRPELQ